MRRYAPLFASRSDDEKLYKSRGNEKKRREVDPIQNCAVLGGKALPIRSNAESNRKSPIKVGDRTRAGRRRPSRSIRLNVFSPDVDPTYEVSKRKPSLHGAPTDPWLKWWRLTLADRDGGDEASRFAKTCRRQREDNLGTSRARAASSKPPRDATQYGNDRVFNNPARGSQHRRRALGDGHSRVKPARGNSVFDNLAGHDEIRPMSCA